MTTSGTVGSWSGRAAGASVEPGRVDRVIAEIAARQQGVVSREQLLAAGIGADAIRHRRERGRLHALRPPVRGVYLVGHVAEPAFARERAALLTAGREGAVLSHRTAAVVLGFAEPATGPVDVTVIGRCPPRRPGIRGHRTELWSPEAWRWEHGLPVTTPARTVLDLAATVSIEALEAIVDRARIVRLVNDEALRGELDARGGTRGAGKLRRLLNDERLPGFSRSEAERLTRRVVRAAALPAPTGQNARRGAHELDFVWARERVVLEVDGLAYHRTPARFEADRARDARLHAAGYRVLRVTWRMLTREPQVVVARLAAVLALAGQEAERAELR